MRIRNKSLMAVLAALVAISMLATGCGGGSGSEEPEGSGGEVTIKIGVGAPLTQGAVALGQGMKRGTALAIAQANESDQAKELGIKFVAVDGDDQGDPKTGVTVANTFASDRQLIGVMGHLNSGVSIPASKVYNENNIVMVSSASTNPTFTQQGFSNVFRVCATDAVQGPAAAEAAFGEFGFKSAVVVDDSTPYGEGLAAEFAKKFEELGGKVIFKEKTADKDSDFNALVTRIVAEKADMIYYGGMYNAGALLSKQASDAGFAGPLMGGDGMFDAEFVKLASTEAAEGDLCTSVGFPSTEMPNGQEFTAAYAEMFPNDEIAAYDGYSYDAANVIIQAVFKVAADMGADQVTSPAGREAVIEAVAATQMDGVTGAVAFDDIGDTTNKAITTYQVVDGAWKPKVLPK